MSPIFFLVAFQVACIYADSDLASVQNICKAPSLSGDAAAKRLRMVDVSKYSEQFLTNLSETPAVCLGNEVYRMELEEPSTMNAAREAIGETSPEAVQNAKTKLVNSLKKNTKLNAPLDNDDWLVRFLRLKNYDVSAASKLIKQYYKYKDQNKKIFDGLVPSKQSSVAAEGVYTILPTRDQAGRRIVVASSKNWNPKKSSILDQLKTGIVLSELGAYEPATQIAGIQVLFDASGITAQQLRQFNPSVIKKIVDYMKAAPFKYEGIHVLKPSRAFGTLYNIFKPFLTEDITSKIFFHGNDMKSLHRHIPASSLPDVYGGSFPMPKFTSYEWATILKTVDKEFAKINSYGLKKED